MTIDSVSSITRGDGALNAARLNNENTKFSELLNKIQSKNESTLSSSQITKNDRLPGDFTSDFSARSNNPHDQAARPVGAAANQANPNVKPRTIDRTSELYEKALQLESYFVKQMVSAMRNTVSKSALNGGGLAGQMYEDMLFDEYSVAMTKNAGFGLADQIYLQLSK